MYIYHSIYILYIFIKNMMIFQQNHGHRLNPVISHASISSHPMA